MSSQRIGSPQIGGTSATPINAGAPLIGDAPVCPPVDVRDPLPDIPALAGVVECPVPTPSGSGSGSGTEIQIITCVGSVKDNGTLVNGVAAIKRTVTFPVGTILGPEEGIIDDPDCSFGGSGSGSGTCDPIIVTETDIECLNGILYSFKRDVEIRLVNGCLQRSAGNWVLDGEKGCCDCGSGSGSGSGTGNPVCCENLPSTLFATVVNLSDCACADGQEIALFALGDGSFSGSGSFGTCDGGEPPAGRELTLLLQCVTNRPVTEDAPGWTGCDKYRLVATMNGCTDPGEQYPLFGSPYTCSCNPVVIWYEFTIPAACCSGGMTDGRIRIVITE